MSKIYFEKLGVYCFEEMTEEEICDHIWELCDASRPSPQGISEKELMQEIDLLCNYMKKKYNSERIGS